MSDKPDLVRLQAQFLPKLQSYTFPFRTEKEYEALGNRLERDERKSEKRPLSSASLLAARHTARFDYARVLGPAYTTGSVRSADMPCLVPEFFGEKRTRHDLFKDAVPTAFTLRLHEPLQQGSGRWSQVWTAIPSLPNKQSQLRRVFPFLKGTTTPEVPGDFVIVKLFQECYFPWPESWDEHLLWRPAEITSHREAWAYETLQSLQGTLLPFSYGFFQFVLPSGLRVVGHVMEHIKGYNIVKHLRKSGSRHNMAVQRPLMLRICRAVYEIHALGVVDLDFRFQNILVPKTNQDSLVVFDFDSARAEVDRFEVEGIIFNPVSKDAVQLRGVCHKIDSLKGVRVRRKCLAKGSILISGTPLGAPALSRKPSKDNLVPGRLYGEMGPQMRI